MQRGGGWDEQLMLASRLLYIMWRGKEGDGVPAFAGVQTWLASTVCQVLRLFYFPSTERPRSRQSARRFSNPQQAIPQNYFIFTISPLWASDTSPVIS